MKTLKIYIAAICLLAFQVTLAGKTPKYVFYLIGDGMGINQATATEYYMHSRGLGDLNFYHFPVFAKIMTIPADKLVTDSAAAGTALSTGHKTNVGMLGCLPDGTAAESLAEKAGRSGRGVGLVTSDAINQATPSAFYAHVKSRSEYDTILSQLINSSTVDFAAGATTNSKKHSASYWISEARAKGIEVFSGDDTYTPVLGRRVLYLSDDISKVELTYAIDRKDGDRSLEDFTSAAIDYLYTNFSKGFFLMIEGANIDHTSHSCDAAATVKEIMDFSRSVDLALEFYRRHPDETLIVVTADHETGSCSLVGNRPEVLSSQNASKTALTNSLTALNKEKRDVHWSEVRELIAEKTGLWKSVPVSREEEIKLSDLYKKSFIDGVENLEKDLYHTNTEIAVEAIRYLDGQAGIIFFQRSHTAAPVGLYAIGVGADRLTSCTDNTDVPKIIAAIAGYK